MKVTKQGILGKLIEEAAKRVGLTEEDTQNKEQLEKFLELLDNPPDWGIDEPDLSLQVDRIVYNIE